uniref:Tetraspanin n=1 Tax=Falco tinnunculus TaxID=100819 RepID=A0A8C4TPH5_FALTI
EGGPRPHPAEPPPPGGAMTVLKLSLMAFSFVFWAAGLTMLIIGLWAKLSLGSYLALSADDYPSAPAILLAAGAAAMVWGFLGCFGAATEHRGLLRLRQALLAYGQDEGVADALDALQRALSCCGVQSYRDWLTSPWALGQNSSVPLSCCRARLGCQRGLPDGLHRDGCFSKVSAFVSGNMFYIATAALGLALLQLIGIVLACLLAARIPAHLALLRLENDGTGKLLECTRGRPGSGTPRSPCQPLPSIEGCVRDCPAARTPLLQRSPAFTLC